jgi:hypothetical protein
VSDKDSSQRAAEIPRETSLKSANREL